LGRWNDPIFAQKQPRLFSDSTTNNCAPRLICHGEFPGGKSYIEQRVIVWFAEKADQLWQFQTSGKKFQQKVCVDNFRKSLDSDSLKGTGNNARGSRAQSQELAGAVSGWGGL
jgi:hypothetical protein